MSRERTTFGTLRDELAIYGSWDLVAGCGALQLLPENADHLTRLEVAASLVASCSNEDGPAMSMSNWRSLFAIAPLSGLAELEDPFDGLFTSQVAFTGGTYTVFAGLGAEATRVQACLARALLDSSPGLTDTTFREWCQRLMVATLRVSDLVATRAGVVRAQKAYESTDGQVTVPGEAVFHQLKSAVTLEEDALAGVDPTSWTHSG